MIVTLNALILFDVFKDKHDCLYFKGLIRWHVCGVTSTIDGIPPHSQFNKYYYVNEYITLMGFLSESTILGNNLSLWRRIMELRHIPHACLPFEIYKQVLFFLSMV